MLIPNRLVGTLRQLLAGPLERLHHSLLGLAQRVREAIASSVSQSAGQVVREAVLAALAELPNAGPRTPSHSYSRAQRSMHSWNDEREDSYGNGWNDDGHYGSYGPQRSTPRWDEDPEEYEERYPGPQGWAEQSIPPTPTPEVSPARAWMSALLTAVEAALWWASHRPGRTPVLAALGIGSVTLLAALILGPLAGVATAVAGTTLALLALVDRARATAAWLMRLVRA